MRLLLTSNGFGNRKIKKEFLNLLDKPVKEIKILLMVSKKKHSYLKNILKELIGLGVKKKNIYIKNLRYIKGKVKKLPEFDVFYSYGGNTFYILDRIRKTGFDKVIRKFVKNNGLYVGLSAGSILVHKTIEIASHGGDKNTIKLKNLKGLNFTNIAIWPHYRKSFEKNFLEFRKKIKYPVVKLKNKQALLIINNKKKFLK